SRRRGKKQAIVTSQERFLATMVANLRSARVVTSKSEFMSKDNFIVVHLNKIISRFLKIVHV
ncbi:hypothetical protein QAC91_10095, partial [Staphylococcus aureus]|nr:hypothetical protein [Staphylococcus aureus]